MGKLRTGKKVFKVVTPERESVFPRFFMFNDPNGKGDKRLYKLAKRKKLLKVYKKGSTVVAKKGAPPLLTFVSLQEAVKWRDDWRGLKDCIIIDVVGYQEEEVILGRFEPDLFRALCMSKDLGLILQDPFMPIRDIKSWPVVKGFRRVRIVS